jgi:hypothetical protein
MTNYRKITDVHEQLQKAIDDKHNNLKNELNDNINNLWNIAPEVLYSHEKWIPYINILNKYYHEMDEVMRNNITNILLNNDINSV